MAYPSFFENTSLTKDPCKNYDQYNYLPPDLPIRSALEVIEESPITSAQEGSGELPIRFAMEIPEGSPITSVQEVFDQLPVRFALEVPEEFNPSADMPFEVETEFRKIQEIIAEKSEEGEEAVERWWLEAKRGYTPEQIDEIIHYVLIFDLERPVKLFEIRSLFVILDLVQTAYQINPEIISPLIAPDSESNIFNYLFKSLFLENYSTRVSSLYLNLSVPLKLFKSFMIPEFRDAFLPSLCDFLRKLIDLKRENYKNTLCEIPVFLREDLRELFIAWNIDENLKRKMHPYAYALIAAIMGTPLDPNFESDMEKLITDSKTRKEYLNYVYKIADENSNLFVHQKAETPILPHEYSLNFMWVHRFKLSDDTQFFLGKNEAEFQKKFTDPMVAWIRKNPGTIINFWIDLAMIPPDVLERSLVKIREMGEDLKYINIREIRELPEIRENSELFDEIDPVYLRVDVARACLLSHLINLYQNGEISQRYSVYCDIDGNPMDATEIFDQRTVDKLAGLGFVMMRGHDPSTYYENGFQIMDGEREKQAICLNREIIGQGICYLKRVHEILKREIKSEESGIEDRAWRLTLEIKINKVWEYYGTFMDKYGFDSVVLTKCVPVLVSEFSTGKKTGLDELKIILHHFAYNPVLDTN